jgi:hypothetical protein
MTSLAFGGFGVFSGGYVKPRGFWLNKCHSMFITHVKIR